MNLRDKIEIFLELWDKIHFFWHWYVGGLLLLIGWTITSDATLDTENKIVVTLTFAAFVGMNVSGLLRSYKLAGAAHKDLQDSLCHAETKPHLGEALNSLTFCYPILAIVYAVGVASGVYAIWRY